MTRTERRIVLAMLLGLMLLATPGLCPASASSTRQGWFSFWIGACGAEVGLLATWAALRRQPLWVRLSGVLRWSGWLFLAILIPVCYAWLAEAGVVLVLFLLSYLVFLYLLLLVPRRWRRWEIVLEEECSPFAPGRPQQYGLRHLLLWMAEAALLLGLFAWLLRDPQRTVTAFGSSRLSLLRPALSAAVMALFSLPMVLAGLPLVLERRPRLRFAVPAILYLLLLPLTLIVINHFPYGLQLNWEVLWRTIQAIGPLPLGYLVSFCLGLLVLRFCGYRLQRGRVTAEPMPDLAAVSADGRSAFRRLVIVLGVLYLAIPWPAWYLQGSRDEQAAGNRRVRPWIAAGMYAVPEETGVQVFLHSPTPAELEVALRALADPQHAAEVHKLYVSSPAWSDAAMPTIAQLVELHELQIQGSKVTDAGLVPLHGLKHLSYISLVNTRVTAEGVAELQQALPDCQIHCSPNPPPRSSPSGEAGQE